MAAESDSAGWVRFWRKYLRLTRSGVTVLRALAICREEDEDPQRDRVLAAMIQSIDAGGSFADAVDAHPEVFSPSVRELIRTAERRGAWDEVLQEVADGLAEGTFS